MRGSEHPELVGEMLSATFDVICEVALSGREHFDADAYSRAILRYFETAGKASLLDFFGAELDPSARGAARSRRGSNHAQDGSPSHRSAATGGSRRR